MATNPPWGATVDGVRALVLDVAAEGARVATRAPRVSDNQVLGWIGQVAGDVAAAIWGYDVLTANLVAQVEVTARGLVETGAAALLSDVTHPERAGNTGRLAAVYLDRFDKGLARLATLVSAKVTEYEAAGNSDPALPVDIDEGAGAGHTFPDSRYPRFTRFTAF